MSELQFMPMDEKAIASFDLLTDIVDRLKGKLLTIVGIRQYASSTDGKIANRQILVGASYLNAQMKDLAKLLRLSPSCSNIENKEWFSDTQAKNDFQLLTDLASSVHTLTAPNFEEFYTDSVNDHNVFYTAWINTIASIVAPQENRSNAQSNAYVQICTGVYQHTENQDRYYIRGFEISKQELAPALNPRNSSSNPRVIAQNAIKFGLNLMMTKYRTLHLREDDTRLKLDGTELSIAMTAEKIREVRATNQAKADKKAEKAKAKKAKKAKEIATQK